MLGSSLYLMAMCVTWRGVYADELFIFAREELGCYL